MNLRVQDDHLLRFLQARIPPRFETKRVESPEVGNQAASNKG